MQSYTIARNALMSRVFFGLFLSLLTASIGLAAGQYVPPVWLRMLVFVELAMMVVAMFLQRSRRIGMPFVLAFTFVSGMTLYPVISYYISIIGAALVLEAAAISGAAFLIAAIVASRSWFDFTFLSGFLFIGLLALVLMGVVSFFVPFGSTASLVYTLLGIAIFIGYVLFDVNRLVHYGVSEQMVPWVVLSLYLDLINLFLFVLRLVGLNVSRR
ncbi:Bax inhibitor-1 family protein [Alicyclobacillus cycloheptanicus]|uniref:FtsH-binding integral membrane protein n=1 Tax=Alicyclobacillus cycloheptanicus TaxID=1457 RepID=A0ABT9XKE8_9BACL|nr:Bax inhibitor-1 family protein [Alicyclobacillus cycloheptanicus]MDQ0190764.1 FtsH-binding integral membrane protein [Alicyclobacillus cycloheptanicus]WDL99852.1 Bax inhibitor-1 family protein [Alicyclobacillus cycloheptanicus]